jgi:hypothetical protein
MNTIQYPYPIATRISMSKDRRIRLPKFLDVPVPYVLLENTQANQPWLGICGLDSLAQLRAECESLRVVAEYWTSRPTIPKIICNRHALSGHEAVWLVAVNSWVEAWSECTFLTCHPRCPLF